ncbi:MAG: pyruvate kinase [Clostridiales bacterium]|nr:pyruvate kinase [Clostridiales bacterium]
MRKTKIICTMGPSTDKEGVLESLIQEGMDVARFNFSHGDYEEQKGRLERLKSLREKYNRPVAALLDTKGPEIRIGCFENGSIVLEEGQIFTLTSEEITGNEDRVSITYKDLYKDVKPGDAILIDDGLIGMEVAEIRGSEISCLVKNGGKISNRKGVNVPDAHLSMDFVSEKDAGDILFGIKEGFDFIAASFTRTADDIYEIRKLLNDNGGNDIQIIAKIENQEGVDNIEEIVEAADGIMIARGDMGVEIPLEEVPIIQKDLIRKVYKVGKPVITATQMLDSMISHPRPTRAETTDVANAIIQGSSAIMLSGETAAGKYPVEALKTMARIAERIEETIDYNGKFRNIKRFEEPDMTNAISHATCMTAIDLNAKAILTVSVTGRTARMISKYRPESMIIGCTISEKVRRQLNLTWGVYPILIREEYSTEILTLRASEAAEKNGFVRSGDMVVLTAGVPLGKPGKTNLIRAMIIGDI